MTWTAFCVKHPGYEHAKHVKDQACGFCGQSNPDFHQKNALPPVIDLSGDSPPRQTSARPGTRALQVSRQPLLEHQQTVRHSRQEAIFRTQRSTPMPNAGSPVHSNRVVPIQAPRVFPTMVQLYQGVLKEEQRRIFHDWAYTTSTPVDLSVDICFKTKDEFVKILTRNFDVWSHICKKSDIQEVMLAGQFHKNQGPLAIPPSYVWAEMDLKSILMKYFLVTKKKKDENYNFIIFLCVGIKMEEEDIDDIPLQFPTKAIKKEATRTPETKAEESHDDDDDDDIKIKIEPLAIDMDAFRTNEDAFEDLDDDDNVDILNDIPEDTSKIKLLEPDTTSSKQPSKKRSFDVHLKNDKKGEDSDIHVNHPDHVESQVDSCDSLVLDAPAFRTRHKKVAK